MAGRTSRPGRGRVRAARRRDERGGAVSLWVVLMVPVSAFAAVVAMAGPQRLAAESSVQEATEDLAVFTVAWRDGQHNEQGPLPAFPFDCAARTPAQQAEFADLETEIAEIAAIAALNPNDPPAAEIARLDDRANELLGQFWLPSPAVPTTIDELRDKFDSFYDSLDAWELACLELADALVRDLGYLGVDMGSLRGFYSDSLATSANLAELPCWITEFRAGQAMVVRDAVHVALAVRWQHAGWAAAQVWPDGLPMAAESVGRLSQRDPAVPPPQSASTNSTCSTARDGRFGRATIRHPTRDSWRSRCRGGRWRAERAGCGTAASHQEPHRRLSPSTCS